jgi:hypothetical protein
VDTYTITNISTATNVSGIVDTNLLIIAQGLPKGVQLENASGTTTSGDAYIRVFLPGGVLNPGQSISQSLIFEQKGNLPVNYTLRFLSGQGNP